MRSLHLTLPLVTLLFLAAAFVAPAHAQAQVADLTAGTVTVQSGAALDDLVFSVTVSNIGTGSSAGTFPVVIQVSSTNGYNFGNWASYSGGPTYVQSQYLPVLAAGSSVTVTDGDFVNGAKAYLPHSGTYQVRVCANMNTVGTMITTESNYGNDCGAWVPVTMSPPTLPDFLGGTVTYSGGVAGVTVTNGSEVASTQSTPVHFVFQDMYTGLTTETQASSLVPPLAPGASGNVSVVVPGTLQPPYAISALADRDASLNQTVPQARTDNDSGGSYFSPSPALTCSVDNSSPPVGTWINYTASWNTGSPSPFTWDDSIGVNGYSTTRTTPRYINAAGSYTMRVSAPRYPAATCPAVTTSASCPVASNKATLTVDKARVVKGQQITLTYTGGGVDTSCNIYANGTLLTTAYPSSCNVGPSSMPLTVNDQTVYKMSCDNGESIGQVIVNVIPTFSNF